MKSTATMNRMAVLAALGALLAAAETRKIVVTGMPPEAIREFQSVSPDVKVVSAEKEQLLKGNRRCRRHFRHYQSSAFPRRPQTEMGPDLQRRRRNLPLPRIHSERRDPHQLQGHSGPRDRRSRARPAAGPDARPQQNYPDAQPRRNGQSQATIRWNCAARPPSSSAWAASARRSRSAPPLSA